MRNAIEIERLATATTNDPRWSFVVARDKSADGSFYYSVKTTGVYCRPSCTARLALPENVQFFETTAEAEKAGFRACKRCKPAGHSETAPNAAKIAGSAVSSSARKRCPSWRNSRSIRRDEHVPSPPDLQGAVTGLTPRG